MPPIPPMPPMSGIPPAFSSGLSAITASVVKNIAATDAAFCSAERVTLAGSTIPASNMFTHSPVSGVVADADFFAFSGAQR